MAFDQLDKYTDHLAGEYQRTQESAYLYSLCMYHDTVLKHAKFKAQRVHAAATIKRINRAFFEGWYKGKDIGKL
jgi:hypothetical protein